MGTLKAERSSRRRVRGGDLRRWRAAAAGIAALAVGITAAAALRRVSRRTGVNDAEASGTLAGDDVIPDAAVQWTRGVAVNAPPAAVWPWLVQQGYDRAGWYTPRWVDRVLNPLLFGTTSEGRPGDRIFPEYQRLEAGDIIADGPDYGAYFRVLEVQPGLAIVYHSIRHPWRANPVDPSDAQSLADTEERLRRHGVYLDFTWTFVLRTTEDGRCRLLIRTRANYSPRAIAVVVPLLGLFDATYGVATLRSIARRAEAAAEVRGAEAAPLVFPAAGEDPAPTTPARSPRPSPG